MKTRILIAAVCFVSLTAHATVYTVTNNNDSGVGSLREAINCANADPADDTINFNIAGSQVHTINLQSELPALLDSFTTITTGGQPNPATNPYPIVIEGSAAGLSARGLVLQASFCTVGGLFITGFADSGVFITLNQTANTIAGCFIAGNAKAGIECDGNINTFLGNTLTANGDEGVFVSLNHIRNQILQNSIFGNGKLGIDLALGGTNVNDDCDTDSGTNNGQNSPVLTSAASDGITTTITGTINSTASRFFTIEFFANSACDASGAGEGEMYIGSTNVITDASCHASFTATLPAAGVTNGMFITATATDGNFHDTSEFSACIPLVVTIGNPPVATNDVYSTDQDMPLSVLAPGVLGNDTDADSDPLTAVQVTGATHGTGTISANGALSYTPTAGFSGLDALTYHANDGNNNSADAAVVISVGADTLTGNGVNVQLHADVIGIDPINITYASVTAPGSTSIAPIDPSLAGTLPGFYFVYNNLVFDITTTANVTGPIDLCFTVTTPITLNQFMLLRVLHKEGVNLVDRTTTSDFPTKTICAQVTSFSPFALALFDPPPHDLAVTKLKAPKKVTLKEGTPPKPGKFSVSVQNLGPATEVISNATVLAQFLQLEVESLGGCAAPVPTLVPPKKGFPVVLAPKKKATFAYTATIDCANDGTAGAGHEDYEMTVTLDHTALDGLPDTTPANDTCPRAPSGADKGCAKGLDVLADVVVK